MNPLSTENKSKKRFELLNELNGILVHQCSFFTRTSGARPEMFKWVGQHKTGWARCM